ncbi:archaetidylserine decarboxylase [Methylocapsa acidiphila]|uniref:archaetidylserine decarboxylase n=1 Tax=Methylocapsa acidiphila TaxID=133552 RepID=UPI0003F5E22F|nr:archaetidylserine decarboxylase [Methylocapsa acidiphila]
MSIRSLIARLTQQEDLNFLLSNRIPRRLATRFMGWFSRIEQPLVRDASIGVWRLFADLDLSEAKKTHFKSMHDCFIRELKDGARPIDADPQTLVSPCDAIVGACGAINGVELMQIKGSTYTLPEFLVDPKLVDLYRNGCYVTLRLMSSMYHHFHAPHDCRVEQVAYVPGDVWNVNPVALKRVDKLFCKNERAVLRTRLAASGHVVTLAPVAAILVAGIRLPFLEEWLELNRRETRTISCDVAFRKGEEMGWFQHGSTIIVFAPDGFTLCEAVREGATIRVGQALMRLP